MGWEYPFAKNIISPLINSKYLIYNFQHQKVGSEYHIKMVI